MDLSRSLSNDIIQRGLRAADERIAAYGPPLEVQRRRLIGLDAVLKAAGVYEGRALDRATLAALDLQTTAMGLLSATDPNEALSAGVAELVYLARALGEAKGGAVLVEVARALGEEPGKPADADGDDGPARLAERFRPRPPA